MVATISEELKSAENYTTPIRNVLLIDDDIDEYTFIRDAFRAIYPDIKVHFANSCDEALVFSPEQFDMVLLDINMPSQDGFHCLVHIRKRNDVYVPVIMYTNSLSPDHIAKAYRNGANLYFVKPDNYKFLLHGLRELLSNDWSDPKLVRKKYQNTGQKLFMV